MWATRILVMLDYGRKEFAERAAPAARVCARLEPSGADSAESHGGPYRSELILFEFLPLQQCVWKTQ